MAKKLRILGVHGLGDHRMSPWREQWTSAITSCFPAESGLDLEFDFAFYDQIFEKTEISFAETMGALFKLGWSGVSGIGRRRKGLGGISDRIRWTAGYVVAWVQDKGFQEESRELIHHKIREFEPDVILGHSLGSLLTYNAFTHDNAKKGDLAKILKSAHYVTFGSQLNNPFVVGNLTHGRLEPLSVKHWHHLFNEHDDVFTAPIRMQGVANFSQLLTPFDIEGLADHSATEYLKHSTTTNSFWLPLARKTIDAKSFGGIDPWRREKVVTRKGAQKRALLVGINEYPREADRLEGCVNDVFTMSAVLQECGFEADDIRTCLDHRATAQGILDRLEWLLEDVHSGDMRVFYYSGHGAQVPEYGKFSEPDKLTETLVPWDFDWSPDTSIDDELIYSLYSQLPYDSWLMLFFDCCHSGGVHRQSGAKAKGISPPDDIRHRELKWDVETGMWVDRDFTRLTKGFSRSRTDTAAYFGKNGATVRLGRAGLLRRDTNKEYEEALSKAEGPVGPYLPLIVEACGEAELSFEYRHGATSYGAFTFCLASILREEKNITFQDLVDKTAARLSELKYEQTPQILGPGVVVNSKVPLNTGTKPRSEAVPGGSTPRLSG